MGAFLYMFIKKRDNILGGGVIMPIREPLDLDVRKKIVYGRHNRVTFPLKTILSKQLKRPTPILNRQHSYSVFFQLRYYFF